jgi:hypothetical protein
LLLLLLLLDGHWQLHGCLLLQGGLLQRRHYHPLLLRRRRRQRWRHSWLLLLPRLPLPLPSTQLLKLRL